MTEPSVYCLLAIHCHQPVGNFGFVFDEAYHKAYEPFLSVLERHPAIRVNLHYSGSLLEWLQTHQPGFFKRLRALVKAGRVELLASGYYEPILPIIPEADRQGQIALMRRMLREQFSARPEGLWLTERVWEPELPETLSRAGIRYTLLDANQFAAARSLLPVGCQIQDDQGWDLLGAYVTEYAGSPLTLFPASKRLRYWIPFQEPSRTVDFLKRLARPQPLAITYADDGEKFGLWPKTFAWVYEQGWLERFFSALERESAWLKTATFSQYLAEVGPNGRVYLPCGSYQEMLEWSGGYFRNFFVKYPEANALLHRMLDLSRRLQDVRNSTCEVQRQKPKGRTGAGRATREASLLTQAQDELYQAQCNDAYWHGVFGGLYLAHLRRAVYHHLIRADQLLQQVVGPPQRRALRDVDGDGRAEVLLRSETLDVVVDPAEEGSVTELVSVRKAVNLADTMARRYESYHEHLNAASSASGSGGAQTPGSIHDQVKTKEEGLASYLAYDDHRRSLFLDYALSVMPSLQEVWRSTWGEHRLWSGGSWTLEPPGRRVATRVSSVAMTRRLPSGSLRKIVSLDRAGTTLGFRYQHRGVAVPVVGLEFNLCLRDERRQQPIWEENAKAFQLRDPNLGIVVTVTADPPATLVTFPIETVSESEEGLERTYQGLALVHLWPTGSAQSWSCEVSWRIEEC